MDYSLVHPNLERDSKFHKNLFDGFESGSFHKQHCVALDLVDSFNDNFRNISLKINEQKYIATYKIISFKKIFEKDPIMAKLNRSDYTGNYTVIYGIFILADMTIRDNKILTGTLKMLKKITDFDPLDTSDFQVFSPNKNFGDYLEFVKTGLKAGKDLNRRRRDKVYVLPPGNSKDPSGSKLLFFDGSNIFFMDSVTKPRVIKDIPLPVISNLDNDTRMKSGQHLKEVDGHYIFKGLEYFVKSQDHMASSFPILFESTGAHVLQIISDAYIMNSRFVSTVLSIVYGHMRHHGSPYAGSKPTTDIIINNKFDTSVPILHVSSTFYIIPNNLYNNYGLVNFVTNLKNLSQSTRNIDLSGAVKQFKEEASTTVNLFTNMIVYMNLMLFGKRSIYLRSIDEKKNVDEYGTLPENPTAIDKAYHKIYTHTKTFNSHFFKYTSDSIRRACALDGTDCVNFLEKWKSMYSYLNGKINSWRILKVDEDNNIRIFLSNYSREPSAYENNIDSFRFGVRYIMQDHLENMIFQHLPRYDRKYNLANKAHVTGIPKSLASRSMKANSLSKWASKLVLYSLGFYKQTNIDQPNTKRFNSPSHIARKNINKYIASYTWLLNGTTVNMADSDELENLLNMKDLTRQLEPGIKTSGSKNSTKLQMMDIGGRLSMIDNMNKYFTELSGVILVEKQSLYGSAFGPIVPLNARESGESGKAKALSLGTEISSESSVDILKLVDFVMRLKDGEYVSDDGNPLIIMVDTSVVRDIKSIKGIDSPKRRSHLHDTAHKIFKMKSLIPEIRLTSMVIYPKLNIINFMTEKGRLFKLYSNIGANLGKYDSIESAIQGGDCFYITNLDNFMKMYPNNYVYSDKSIKEAMSKDVCDKNEVYDYDFVYPSGYLGYTLSMMNGVPRNSLARIVYNSNMLRQGLMTQVGLTPSNYLHGLYNRKMFASSFYNYRNPTLHAGIPTLTAISIHKGFTQEDAKIINPTLFGMNHMDAKYQSTQVVGFIKTKINLAKAIKDLNLPIDAINKYTQYGMPIIGKMYEPLDPIILYMGEEKLYKSSINKLKYRGILLNIMPSSRDQIKFIFTSYVPGMTGVKGVSTSAQKGQMVASKYGEISTTSRGISLGYIISLFSGNSRMTGGDPAELAIGMKGLCIDKSVLFDSSMDISLPKLMLDRVDDSIINKDTDYYRSLGSIDKQTFDDLTDISQHYNTLDNTDKYKFSMIKEVKEVVYSSANRLDTRFDSTFGAMNIGVFLPMPLHHISLLKKQSSKLRSYDIVKGNVGIGHNKAFRVSHMKLNAYYLKNLENVMKELYKTSGRTKITYCRRCNLLNTTSGTTKCIKCKESISNLNTNVIRSQFLITMMRLVTTGVMIVVSKK